VDVVKELIGIKFPLDLPKSNGITAVGICALKGNVEMMDILFRAGANIMQT
jgi:ankyrin repeat protein